jgi:ABC-type transport system substrate-binding protein
MRTVRVKFAALATTAALALSVAMPASAELDPAHKGGTMRLLPMGAGGTIDPHVNYTLQYWQVYQSIYDGFGCDSFHPGSDSSVNISGFCDKEIDARMKEALKLAVTDQETADDLWAEIDKAVMDKAPAVPLFTPKHVDFLSKRVGNFKFNAQFYWVVTQSWVQ